MPNWKSSLSSNSLDLTPSKKAFNNCLSGFDDRLDFQFGIKISELIEESLFIYKKLQLRWAINKIKNENHLNQDLTYAINELNLCNELDLNHKTAYDKLSLETKKSLLKKFNHLLVQK